VTGTALLPALLAAAFVLLWSGVGKLRQPAAAAEFLRSMRLPFPYVLVRAAAVAEIAVGGAVLFWPRAAATGMAVLYSVFAVVVAAQLRQPTGRPCGCFGADTSPPSHTHLGLNLICLLLGVAAVVAPPPSFWTLAPTTPFAASLAGLVAVAVAVLGVAAVQLLPGTMGAWRGAGA
jgi:uncharacterized membrane protein YphA (DoxX/SURF4 family)